MKIVVDEKYQHLTDTIARLPQRMDEGEGEVVYDSRNRVVRFTVDGLSLMVKRFKRVNAVQQVVYTFFRKTKAERAFLFASEFLKRGIDTPQPVAYMEERHHGLFTTGYFVSLETPGTETSLLLREVQDYPRDLAEAVARQVVLMHSKGILHGDLNLSNFLVKPTPDLSPREGRTAYSFTMIDTNRSHFCDGYPSDSECLKNMVRLTHRRDLYEDLVRRYALLRGWDADETASRCLALLTRFEHRKLKL
ncbi:MAG: hypothetical protein J5797_02605 [Prevotella sp.]|nr:hypothetical protein [Prevotella sp.]